MRAPDGVSRHRLPALLQHHLVERAAAHLLPWCDALFFDEEERAVPFPDGVRRREGVGELARPERGGVEPQRLAEVEVLGLLELVHLPVLAAVEGRREPSAATPLAVNHHGLPARRTTSICW
jgi:hypothetical protein